VVVPEITCTLSVSYAVVVVVSLVATFSQNDSVALVADGIVTDWDSVSVCEEP